MEWIDIKEKLPITYKTGDWDGKKSDTVLVQHKDGNYFTAVVYKGIIDGKEFRDWYNIDCDCVELFFDFGEENILRWCEIK